jgi:hypothetical protein
MAMLDGAAFRRDITLWRASLRKRVQSNLVGQTRFFLVIDLYRQAAHFFSKVA